MAFLVSESTIYVYIKSIDLSDMDKNITQRGHIIHIINERLFYDVFVSLLRNLFWLRGVDLIIMIFKCFLQLIVYFYFFVFIWHLFPFRNGFQMNEFEYYLSCLWFLNEWMNEWAEFDWALFICLFEY